MWSLRISAPNSWDCQHFNTITKNGQRCFNLSTEKVRNVLINRHIFMHEHFALDSIATWKINKWKESRFSSPWARLWFKKAIKLEKLKRHHISTRVTQATSSYVFSLLLKRVPFKIQINLREHFFMSRWFFAMDALKKQVSIYVEDRQWRHRSILMSTDINHSRFQLFTALVTFKIFTKCFPFEFHCLLNRH